MSSSTVSSQLTTLQNLPNYAAKLQHLQALLPTLSYESSEAPIAGDVLLQLFEVLVDLYSQSESSSESQVAVLTCLRVILQIDGVRQVLEHGNESTLLFVVYFLNSYVMAGTGSADASVGVSVECSELVHVLSLRAVFGVGAQESEFTESLLHELETLRKNITSMLQTPSTGVTIKTRCVKYLEAILLCTTAQDATLQIYCTRTKSLTPAATRIVPRSLLPAPNSNADTILRTISDEVSDALLQCLFDQHQSATIVSALITSFMTLMKYTPSLWEKLVGGLTLLDLAVREPDNEIAKASQSARSPGCVHLLRLALLTVLRIPKAVDHHEEVEKALEECGMAALIQETKEVVLKAATNPPPPQPAAAPRKRREVDNLTTSIQTSSASTGSRPKRTKSTALPKDNLLPTSRGPMKLSDIVQAVLFSLKLMPVNETRTFSKLHETGIVEAQANAARRLQLLKLDALRQQESRSVTDIPFGELFEYVKPLRQRAIEKSSTSLNVPRNRDMCTKLAVETMIAKHADLTGSVEKQQAAALIGRVCTMVGQDYEDIVVDTILDHFMKNPDANLELLQLMLYSQYFALAPEEGKDDEGFSDVIRGPDPIRVDVERPLAWMQHRRAMKRDANGVPAGSQGYLEFLTDLPMEPTNYSVVLMRCLWAATQVTLQETAKKTNGVNMLEEILVSCPSITPFAWNFINKYFCLAPVLDTVSGESDLHKLQRVELGLRVLSKLAKRRPAVSAQAVSLLLHYSQCPTAPTRVGAVKLLVNELLLDPRFEHCVIQSALQAVESILNLRSQKNESGGVVIKTEGARTNPANPNTPATTTQTQLQFIEQNVSRKLALYFVLCTRQPENIQHIFTTFAKCAEHMNEDVQTTLLDPTMQPCKDFTVLIVKLSKTSANVTLLNFLTEFPKGSERLTLQVLRTVADCVKSQLKDLGSEQSGSSGTSKRAAELHATTELLVHACRQVYSTAKLHDGNNDVRFLIPVFCFIPKSDLKTTFLPQVLHQAMTSGSDEMIKLAFREVFRAVGPEKATMSLTELFLYLHELSPRDVNITAILAGIKTALSMTNSTSASNTASASKSTMLYNFPTLAGAFHQMLQMNPLPPLMMRTVSMCLAQDRDDQMLRWVSNELVRELVTRKVWEDKDKTQWKGLMKFIDQHWPRTLNTLLSFPEDVLMSELVQRPDLRARIVQCHQQGLVSNQYSALLARMVS